MSASGRVSQWSATSSNVRLDFGAHVAVLHCWRCSVTQPWAAFLVANTLVGRTCLPVTGSVPSVGRARHPLSLGNFLIELSVRSPRFLGKTIPHRLNRG